MNIDFHTHGKLTKKLPFSKIYTEWLFKEAKAKGLDALCLTEHFHTQEFDLLYQYIATHYQKVGDTFVVDGLHVFPGMEVDVLEGGHVLVIGGIDTILELNNQLNSYKKKPDFIPFKELVELVKGHNVLLGAAHPYRKGSHLPELDESLQQAFDFVDLNGKDLATMGDEAWQKVEAMSQRLGIPFVAGSDTHQALQYGCVYSQLSEDCYTINELRRALEVNEIYISKHIEDQVSSATLLKKALKAIDVLGGDYVEVLLDK